jgi:starch phosphorylase
MDQSVAKDLAQWKSSMQRLWPQVRIDETEAEVSGDITIGTMIPVRTKVFVGDLPPEDIAVDAYFGVLDSRGSIIGGELVPLKPTESLGQAMYLFTGEIESRFCGRHGFLVRAMPKHARLGTIYEPGLTLGITMSMDSTIRNCPIPDKDIDLSSYRG